MIPDDMDHLQELIELARQIDTCRHAPWIRTWAKSYGCQLPHCGAPDCELCPDRFRTTYRPFSVSILSPRFAALDWRDQP